MRIRPVFSCIIRQGVRSRLAKRSESNSARNWSKPSWSCSCSPKQRIASFAGRVGFVFVAGILAAIATNVSYWNWYGFPRVYTASYMLTQIVGFFLVGIVAAFVLPGDFGANLNRVELYSVPIALRLCFVRPPRRSASTVPLRQAPASFIQIKSKMIAPITDRMRPAG